ncbi:MAG TPA: hypothetical protein VGI81_24565 [Tepidisphaeraceae bacterium]
MTDDVTVTTSTPKVDKRSTVIVSSFGGRLILEWDTDAFVPSRAEHDAAAAAPATQSWEYHTRPVSQAEVDPAIVRQFDFKYRSDTTFVPRIGSFPPSRLTQRAFDVPYWTIMCAAFIPVGAAVMFLLRRWARRRKLKSGHCPQCGYDLRATPTRCPECGWRPAPEAGEGGDAGAQAGTPV